ncbi:D-cysteine desulfhydrase [Balamuthia mandrillaris]
MLSLPLDLLRNEREQQQREQHAQRAKTAFHFRDVFVDCGTGMSAAALILTLDWLHRLPFTRVHVLHLAGSPSSSSNTDEEEFLQVLNRCQDFFLHQLHSASSPASSSTSSSFERWTGSLLKERGVRLYRPVDAPSFGSVNQSVLRYVAEFACREGILLDPVYSAKLFRLAEEQGRKKEMQTEDGGCVVIHSGGALALSGFQKRLARMTFL